MVLDLLFDYRTMLGTVILAGLYAVHCLIWPFKPCRTCRGAPKNRGPFSQAYKLCRRCKGRGGRIRTGRKLLARLGIDLPAD
ncbi:hypothetical protein AB0I28_19720 [Phytomonospora sp. NPDC050363]|uniref:hypothetical protein n=1 Tax=Phytomonospora sp. NPDC050363 TaxID=3155642 RepID=UPI0033FE966C